MCSKIIKFTQAFLKGLHSLIVLWHFQTPLIDSLLVLFRQQVYRDGPHLPQETAAPYSSAPGSQRAPAARRWTAQEQQQLCEKV